MEHIHLWNIVNMLQNHMLNRREFIWISGSMEEEEEIDMVVYDFVINIIMDG